MSRPKGRRQPRRFVPFLSQPSQPGGVSRGTTPRQTRQIKSGVPRAITVRRPVPDNQSRARPGRTAPKGHPRQRHAPPVTIAPKSRGDTTCARLGFIVQQTRRPKQSAGLDIFVPKVRWLNHRAPPAIIVRKVSMFRLNARPGTCVRRLCCRHKRRAPRDRTRTPRRRRVRRV